MHKRTRFWLRLVTIGVATLILALFGTTVYAQDGGATAEDITSIKISLDTTWLLVTGFLIFFMQTGFAMLEAGLVRQTAVVNALLENFVDACITGVVFWALGFGFAFGTSAGGFIGTDNFFLNNAVTFTGEGVEYAQFGTLNVSVLTFFFFQFAFAATASTIATGGMAERTNFVGDLIYSVIISTIIYPVVVHWVWGGGWLSALGFHDFAGSTVVHTVGAMMALMGAIFLGPRKGRVFGNPPRPHNLGMATLGTMVLWFGWFGFNPGSSLGVSGYEGLIGLVTVNTVLAGAAGTLACMFFVYSRTGKWDLSATLNGLLAGLVGVTAGCGFIAPWASIIIGLVSGVLVILVTDLMEKLKIDDPVGAFAVHGACGIFGTLAIGLFAQPELTFAGAMAGQGGLFTTGSVALLGVQALGSAATIVWSAVTGAVLFGALKSVKMLRVPAKADEVGIDVYEHGASIWPDILPVPEDIPVEGGKRAAAPAVGD